MGKVGLAPVIGMMMAECAHVGLMFAGKAAMSDGMSNLVFVFYSKAFASLVLLPASLLFHSTSSQFFGYAGIYYSSPTLSTALLNLVPGFTFILAIIFRVEKLDWRSSSSLAKSVGTIVLITGAFIMTYYKGPHLLMTSLPPNSSLQVFMPQTNWVFGGLLLAVDCVFTSAWFIVQASILKKFSAEFIVVFFYCFFVAIQSAILCLVMERDLSSWSLKPGVRLVAVLYSAVFGSAFQVGVCTWCLHRTGPVFVAMFKPLGVVISAAVGTIFLGETVYLGRFIGAAVIFTGFYSVMWGKAKEGNSGVETGVYRGPFIRKAASDDKLEAKINPPLFIFYSTPDRWVLGCTLLAASSLSVCVWNIIQAIFGSVIRSTVHVSCAEMKGHLYVPMFKPFGIVFATAFGSTFFTNSLHYGSVIGAVITGMGYYTVTWGNIREDELLRKGHNSKDAADDQKVPLLQEDSQV
ncbi:WAT1-related protein [Citrus sinensis]|uniref:WAT1-related protein n=1 Tax=Citrus sinensis TaxID=2711 RepID=A0ACB8LJT1_CITSI|nr:WAT1-related protein [Citrus sinensis]